jgi:hypothetical protein
MSRNETTAPITWPSLRIGVAPYSAGNARRSAVQSTSSSTKHDRPSRYAARIGHSSFGYGLPSARE